MILVWIPFARIKPRRYHIPVHGRERERTPLTITYFEDHESYFVKRSVHILEDRRMEAELKTRSSRYVTSDVLFDPCLTIY